MKVVVNQDACIGCGACAAICDEVFDIDDEGLSVTKKEDVPSNLEESVRDAADSCPTSAIEIEE